MSSFHEVRFPVEVAFGATGGPVRKTEIVTMASGHEARNARWKHARRSFNAGTGIKTLDDLQLVVAFFEERRGALHGFRFRDPMDWKSCAASQEIAFDDQVIGGSAYLRDIHKPVLESLRIGINGVEQSAGAYALDDKTGLVDFNIAPLDGSIITAGFAFDVPVRFETDSLTVNLAKFAAGDIPSVPLAEIRP